MSFVSGSIAVQVQVLPAPGGGRLAYSTDPCLQYVNAQISSASIRRARTPRTFWSCQSRQATPASISSFVTVLMLHPTVLAVARMLTPSTRSVRIRIL